MNFKKRLQRNRDLWDQAKTNKKDGFERYPDGIYRAKLGSAEVTESSTGNVGIKMFWVLDDPGEETDGKKQLHWLALEGSEGAIGMTQKTMRQLGYETPDNPEDIVDQVADLNERAPTVRIQLKTNGEYQNTYIKKVFDDDDDLDSDDTPFDASEDETSDPLEELETEPEPEPEPEPEEPEAETETANDDDDDEWKEGDEVEVAGRGKGKIVKVDFENGMASVLFAGKKRASRVALDSMTLVE